MDSGERAIPNRELVSYVYVGPDGIPLTPSDLPPATISRWVPRRKAVVAAAVEAGLLSLEEARRRYTLTEEELTAWRSALKEFGPTGLRATKSQYYRGKRTPSK